MSMKLSINGEMVEVDAPAGMPLLWVLRDHLGLTGTKYGCGIAQCGACTVHIDGEPRRACATPVGSLGNAAVVTVEAVDGKEADAVRGACGRAARGTDAARGARAHAGRLHLADRQQARRPSEACRLETRADPARL